MIAFIWGNSLLPGTQSSDLSGSITFQLYQFLHLSLDFDLFHHFIRKCAHFSEYAVLGIFTYNWMKEINSNLLLSVLICFIIACCDEIIQSFIPNRGPAFTDCLIDTSGALFGTLCFLFVLKYMKKRGKN